MLLALPAPAQAQACGPTSGTQRLLPGRPVEIAAAAADPPLEYVIPVPSGLLNLIVETSGGVGNPDLYVRLGSPPTTLNAQHVSAGPGARETISIESPPRGCWFVAVRTSTAYTGVRLRTRFEVRERQVLPERPETGISDDRTGEFLFFTVDVPDGAEGIKITTTGGTGDADLFVQQGDTPTDEAFGAQSTNAASSDEEVAIATPQGGPWKIALKSTTPYSDVTLEVDIEDDRCVADETKLCLLERRFRVEVHWVNQHAGGESGEGFAVPDSEQTGSFWFFDEKLSELTVKLIDGRAADGTGCFWFFFSALTDVGYSITVTDTETLGQRFYANTPGSPSSGFDTRAFCSAGV